MAEKKEKRKESFVMYESFIDAASYLDGNDFKECILRIKDYALYGDDKPSDNQIINVILAMAKPNLDAAEKRRQKQIENGMKGKEYGILGGRKPKSQDNSNNPSKPLKGDITEPLNVNDNVNVDDNEKVNENGNGDGKDDVNKPLDNDKTSSFPSPSLSSSFSSFNNIGNDRSEEQQTAINPRVTNKEEKDNKKSISSGSVAAAAPVYQEMSICDYLKEIINNNVVKMLKYDEEHRDYDEEYKNLHVEAVKAFMGLKGGEYKQADNFIKYLKKHYYDEA